MPKKNGTGPSGKGPMTGLGKGRCVIPLNTPGEELNFLKNQEQALQKRLNGVRTRIKELEAEQVSKR
jgi:hypothetical protein